MDLWMIRPSLRPECFERQQSLRSRPYDYRIHQSDYSSSSAEMVATVGNLSFLRVALLVSPRR